MFAACARQISYNQTYRVKAKKLTITVIMSLIVVGVTYNLYSEYANSHLRIQMITKLCIRLRLWSNGVRARKCVGVNCALSECSFS